MKSYFFVVLVLVTVVLNTVAQTLLKLGTSQNIIINIYLLSGILAYGLSTVFYLLVLSKINLSISYPAVIGLTVVATTFSGAVIFREQIPTIHWLGIGLMLSGICAIAFGKIF